MAVADNPDSSGAMSDDDLVAEARAEAIKDGDPETCLVWDLANAIERLQAEAEHWKANHDEQVRRKRHVSELLAAAKADAERLAIDAMERLRADVAAAGAAAHRALIEDARTIDPETWAEGLEPDQLQPGQASYVDPEPVDDLTRCGECGGHLGTTYACDDCGTQHNGPNTPEPPEFFAAESMADWVHRELEEVIIACEQFLERLAFHPDHADELDGCEFTVRCLDMRRVLDIDGSGTT